MISEGNRALMELKEDLRDSLGDSLVGLILFGSRARGDYDNESDIDIAIIVQGLSRELKNRIFNKVARSCFKILGRVHFGHFCKKFLTKWSVKNCNCLRA